MTPHDDTAKLEESLRLTRLELAQVREQLEVLMEERAVNDEAQARLRRLADAASEGLRQVSGSGDGLRGWVKRRLLRHLPGDEEAAQIARIESSALFDGGWYFMRHPQAAASGLSAALHFLRIGAHQGFDPGPSFDVRAYRRDHPDLGDENPLLHLLASDSPER